MKQNVKKCCHEPPPKKKYEGLAGLEISYLERWRFSQNKKDLFASPKVRISYNGGDTRQTSLAQIATAVVSGSRVLTNQCNLIKFLKE